MSPAERSYRTPILLLLLLLLLLPAAVLPAGAQPFRSAIVYDPLTREVLYEHNAHELYPTASMVKMMTLLVVMDHVESGDLEWDQPVEVSARASLVGGSQVYLKEGEVFTVGELVAATMISSANDAAYLLAEVAGGTVEEFVEEMNAKAEELGLEESHFHTPHGLPPEKPGQHNDVMSAHDLALVGAEVLRHRRLAELASTETRPFRGGEFGLYNSNHLLRRYDYAIGIKTGWTRDADFCLTAAASKHNRELIAVVMGTRQKFDSFDSAQRLLEEAFERFHPVTLVEKGERLPQAVAVEEGARANVSVVAADSVELMLNGEERSGVRTVAVGGPLRAPVKAGEDAGEAVVLFRNRVIGRVPVVAAEAVDRAAWWQRAWSWVVDLL